MFTLVSYTVLVSAKDNGIPARLEARARLYLEVADSPARSRSVNDLPRDEPDPANGPHDPEFGPLNAAAAGNAGAEDLVDAPDQQFHRQATPQTFRPPRNRVWQLLGAGLSCLFVLLGLVSVGLLVFRCRKSRSAPLATGLAAAGAAKTLPWQRGWPALRNAAWWSPSNLVASTTVDMSSSSGCIVNPAGAATVATATELAGDALPSGVADSVRGLSSFRKEGQFGLIAQPHSVAACSGACSNSEPFFETTDKFGPIDTNHTTLFSNCPPTMPHFGRSSPMLQAGSSGGRMPSSGRTFQLDLFQHSQNHQPYHHHHHQLRRMQCVDHQSAESEKCDLVSRKFGRYEIERVVAFVLVAVYKWFDILFVDCCVVKSTRHNAPCPSVGS
ncbi:unnamed protein product [Protopolystoma xenopodis]|uniref:Uncharacterized protein n=1 Tax=Protopolystoma xenopodis TaxID=117903 RepID=A0A3S5CI33_9PLAT|nr:unnamed protein product [Protopolystoma xenopodis]